MSRRRLLLALPVLVIAGGAAVLAVEIQLARWGRGLPELESVDQDGRVGGPGPAVSIVWLGDSTAAGVGASGPDGTLPLIVARRLDRPVDLTVLAESGARVGDVLDDQVPAVAGLAPDLVVISVGSNDVSHLTRAGDFRSRYTDMLDRLPGDTAAVLLGVPDMGSITRLAQPLRFVTGVRGGTLDAELADLARDRGLAYVDIAGEAGPSFRDDPDRYLAADQYHPSDAGYRLWADAAEPAVREALN